MSTKSLEQAAAIAQKLGHIFVATADASGMPHIAAAAEMKHLPNNTVTVSAWFCPGTLANLEQNRSVSLTVWDEPSDSGFQILGRVENINEKAVMNGYRPEIEVSDPMPQVERTLVVAVSRVLVFSHAPHSDVEE